uniref:Uncharacterized protein n=1 Tax=Oryza rufipogon TaxID=4529 RepID=A0A0E0RE22_ORYRU
MKCHTNMWGPRGPTPTQLPRRIKPGVLFLLHPGDGKFVCGKRNQRDEFFLLRNRLLTPYTRPKKEAEREPPCPGLGRSNLGWGPLIYYTW